jgi:hypothetical protein
MPKAASDQALAGVQGSMLIFGQEQCLRDNIAVSPGCLKIPRFELYWSEATEKDLHAFVALDGRDWSHGVVE